MLFLRFTYSFLSCFLCCLSSILVAQSDSGFTPNDRPRLVVPKVVLGVQLDGVLNEEAWQHASTAENFSEYFPNEKAKPPIGLKAMLMHDGKNLYVAFKITDDPTKIRASLRNRDEIWQDDYAGLVLDTYGNQQWGYFLASNPLGVQGDERLLVNSSSESAFNIEYQTAGKITEDGYQIEMRIPFTSLRFPESDNLVFRGNFWVSHPRASQNSYSWAGLTRNNSCLMCQYGYFEGLKSIRNVTQRVEVMPALIGSNGATRQDALNPNSTFERAPLALNSFDPSINLKYNLTSSATAELTVNPDFSQIESDQTQIDVNANSALFFPERRPFFQEGADIYSTFTRQVYSRSINKPLTAAKFTGRFGQTSLGYIGALDEASPLILPFEDGSSTLSDVGRSVSNILRVRQTLKKGSHVGTLITDRRLVEGGYGSTLGVDALLRLNDTDQIEVQIIGSNTNEPNNSALYNGSGMFDAGKYTAKFDGERFSGSLLYLSHERTSRTWFWDADFWATSPTFRADNGFVQSNDRKRIGVRAGRNVFPKDKWVVQYSPYIMTGYDWNYDRQRKDEYLFLGVNSQLKGQTRLSLGTLVHSKENFRKVEFESMQRFTLEANSDFSQRVGIGFFLQYGEMIARRQLRMGIGTNIGLGFEFKPTGRLTIEPEVNYSQLGDKVTKVDFFEGYIVRTRATYQFTRALSARMICEYDDFNVLMRYEPLLTYQISPFSVFYVGASLSNKKADIQLFPEVSYYPINQSVFFKFQYLFKI
ncbi:MAG: carbohydrate binding family 9 domain-containing protein [Bacteroidetes Order II. Incertae sedis bacterium]|nr:carbohydrate binding family 9 domain-containing protein [Bacteroidetes Order II. bacterium]